MPKPLSCFSLLLFSIIVLAPLLVMFSGAFVPAENFWETVLLDGRRLALFENSLLIGGGTAFFSLLVGLPLAFLIARTDLPLKKLFLFASIIPVFIPSYISTIGWLKFLGPGGLNLPFKIYGLGGVIFILTASCFPFITLLTLAGLYSVDLKLEEAGALVYRRAKVLKHITLPLIFPYVFSGAILTFIFSVSNYGVPDLLRVTAYPVEIFTQFSAFYDSSKATLLALPLIGVTIVLVLMQRHFMGKKAYVAVERRSAEHSRISLGRYKIPAVIFVFVIIFFSVIMPLSLLLAGAGSFKTYIAAIKTARSQIINSVVLSSISATLITILSFPLAYLVQRANKRVSLTTDILSVIPFAIPPAILGIGLIQVWNRPATGFIYKTFLVIIFGYAARFIAFCVRIISSSISQIHPNLEEAADIACDNFWKKLSKIILPLTKHGILYGWLICFALCIGELETTLLVAPAGESTLPIRIYTLMHYGAHKLVFGLCVILIALIFLPLGAVFLTNKPLLTPGVRKAKKHVLTPGVKAG